MFGFVCLFVVGCWLLLIWIVVLAVLGVCVVFCYLVVGGGWLLVGCWRSWIFLFRFVSPHFVASI